MGELQKFCDCIEEDVFKVLSVSGSVDRRVSKGGTSEKAVSNMLTEAETKLGML